MEASGNLNALKKKYDEIRELCNRKDAEIAKMRVRQFSLYDITGLTGWYREVQIGWKHLHGRYCKRHEGNKVKNQFDIEHFEQRYEQMQKNLELVQLKYEEALLSKESYDHVLERMKVKDIRASFFTAHLDGPCLIQDQTACSRQSSQRAKVRTTYRNRGS